jgi:hypothetical protein
MMGRSSCGWISWVGIAGERLGFLLHPAFNKLGRFIFCLEL